MPEKTELLKQIEQVKAELAEAEAALPAHSVRPWQVQRVEDLEDRLKELEEALAVLA